MDEKLEEANLLILQKIPTLMELRMLHMQALVLGDRETEKYSQILEECKQKQKLLDEIAKAELFIKKNETSKSEQSKIEKIEAILLKYKPAYGPGGSGPPLPSLRERYIKELEQYKLDLNNAQVAARWMYQAPGSTNQHRANVYVNMVATAQKLVEAIIEAEAFVMDYKAKILAHEAKDKAQRAHEAHKSKLHKETKEAKEAENYKTLVKEMQPIWEQCNDKHSTQIHLAPNIDAKIAIIRDCIRPHLVYKKLISEAEAEPLLLTRYLNEEIRPYFLMGGKKYKHSKTKNINMLKQKNINMLKTNNQDEGN